MLLHPQLVSHRSGAYAPSDDDAPHLRVITRKWEEDTSSDEYDDFEAFNPGVEDPITDYKGQFGVISIKKILLPSLRPLAGSLPRARRRRRI